MSSSPDEINVTIEAQDQGLRLDKMLALRVPELSRSRLQALVRDGQVRLDGKVMSDPAQKIAGEGIVTILVPPPVPAAPEPEAITLDIVYEDNDLIVIHKPAGLVVHPGAGNRSGTLVNALLAHCGDTLSGIGGVARPGIVHRLDKDTSGLMVVAKHDKAHKHLSAQFADHGRTGELKREYLALVWGVPALPSGVVDAPLDRHPGNHEKRAVRHSGKEAVTHWQVQERFYMASGKGLASLVACQLETGRTHQIRVHMAHIGHPLLGDGAYGSGFLTRETLLDELSRDALKLLGRQALHAWLLGFIHPLSGDYLEFTRDLPKDFARLVDALRFKKL